MSGWKIASTWHECFTIDVGGVVVRLMEGIWISDLVAECICFTMIYVFLDSRKSPYGRQYAMNLHNLCVHCVMLKGPRRLAEKDRGKSAKRFGVEIRRF